MKRYRQITACFLVLLGVAGAAAAQDATKAAGFEQVHLLQETCVDVLRIYRSDRDDALKTLDDEYQQQLGRLELAGLADSDLPAILAVRQERMRFTNTLVRFSTETDGVPEKLVTMRLDYRRRWSQLSADYARRVLRIVQQYHQHLKAVLNVMIQQGDLSAEEARELWAQRHMESALVEADSLLNDAETVSGEVAGLNSARSPANKPQHPYRIYVADDAPRVQSKSLPLSHTGQRSRSLVSHLSGFAEMVEEETSEVQEEPNGNRRKAYITLRRPRVRLVAGREDISGGVLLVEYFLTDAGQKRIREKTERVPLPHLPAGQVIVVDLEGLELRKSKYITSDGRVYDDGQPSGEYSGFIISVFDVDGKLVYQRCTTRALARYAPDVMPE
jgi:hypothetical protein